MRFPVHVAVDTALLQLRSALKGQRRYPLVMMLEPLYTCNLACVGCATERHTGKLRDRLPVATCLEAADACGAPVVSVCGGEPTLYPELPELLGALFARRRHVYLCTNALALDRAVFGVVPPNRRLTINVHLDGMEETHDRIADRPGVFAHAMAMIREAKGRGYHVMTNTTVFKDTPVEELEALCAALSELGVDGMLLSPGYHYESTAAELFPTRAELHRKFRRVLELSRRFRLASTPMYLEFAAGLREYRCSPWSTVTFTPRGWKGPCYLIGERYTHDWREFWEGTDWARWESREDPRCQGCAMHSGFEASAVIEARRSARDLARLLAWNLGAAA
jgi:hopanoid biosynthesis associated radical SAM protein HpnH